MHGNYPLLPNETLARLVDGNLRELGGFLYDDKERAFAREIRTTLTGELPAIDSTAEIRPFGITQGMGSTDVGDVSWNVPTVGFGTATWVPGTPAHSWQAVAAGGTSIGHRGMALAARLLARTAEDLIENPTIIDKARAELVEKRGEDFEYEALLGDRAPPLDYRL
jgi:aminobenzoyl-glutamate utilization protein B